MCARGIDAIVALLLARQPKWLTTRSSVPQFSSNPILRVSKIIIIIGKKKTNERDTFSRGNFCLEKLRVSGATIVVLNRTKRASKRAERLRFQRERKRERLSSLLPFSSSGIIVCKQRTRAGATGFRSCTCSPLFFFFLHFPFSSEAAKCSWESK